MINSNQGDVIVTGSGIGGLIINAIRAKLNNKQVLILEQFTSKTPINQSQSRLFLKSLVVWLVFIVAESLNGTIRNLLLVPFLGDFWAHQISFFTGSILVLAIALLFVRWLNTSRVSQLLGIGVLWLLLTVAFEIALGRLILGYSWGRIAADYNLLQGGLMPVGLILLAIAPLIAAKIRG